MYFIYLLLNDRCQVFLPYHNQLCYVSKIYPLTTFLLNPPSHLIQNSKQHFSSVFIIYISIYIYIYIQFKYMILYLSIYLSIGRIISSNCIFNISKKYHVFPHLPIHILFFHVDSIVQWQSVRLELGRSRVPHMNEFELGK